MSFLLLLALAQQTPVELLTQVDENYKSLKTFHIEMDSVADSKTENRGEWSRRQWVLILESPTKLRFATNGFMGNYEIVSDGVTLWRAAGHLRQYSATPVTGPVIETRGGGNEAFNAMGQLRSAMPSFNPRSRRLQSAEYLADEVLLDGGKPVNCRVIRAIYEPMPGQTLWERKFWIDPVRKIVLKEFWLNEGTSFYYRPYEMRRGESTATYKHVHLGSLPADTDFKYVPPANYGGVDKLEVSGMPMPKSELLGKPAPELVSQFKGKVVVLNFWATWCAPCREQMPKIVQLYQQIKDQDVVMIGVNGDESEEKAKEYAKKNGLEWTQWMDTDHRAKFRVNAIPTLIVVDREGKIVAYEVGSGVEVERNLRGALAKMGVKLGRPE